MPQASITQAFVDRLPQAEKTTWFHDTALSGFQLCVGKSSKTFYACAEFKGSFRRTKIGRADLVKANTARALTRNVLLPELKSGIDPRGKFWTPDDDARTDDAPEARTTLRGIRAQQVVIPKEAPETFQETWEQYRAFGSKAKTTTLNEYARTLHTCVPQWLDRPTVTIDEDEVLKAWRRLSRGSLPMAKALMRTVSAVMHDAKKRKIIDSVPTSILPRGWSTVIRNPKRIPDIREWWRQVDNLPMYPKSALKLLLLTGWRPGEVLSLKWSGVDLEAGTIRVEDPKVGPSRDVAIPVQSVRQLKRLEKMKGAGFFVFPSSSHRGYLQSLPAGAGKPVTARPKDCRNEWDSIAAELGIPHTQRQFQMGHTAGSMTDSYVVTPDVRSAVQKVADEVMRRVQGAVS